MEKRVMIKQNICSYGGEETHAIFNKSAAKWAKS